MKFIQENDYIGKQIFVDSDRLVFNGRDDVIFSSHNGFVFKTKGEFHLNTKQDTYLNSPRIFLGPVKDGEDPNIPATNTVELEEFLYDLISTIKVWLRTSFPSTSGNAGGPNLPVNQGIGESLASLLEILETKVDPTLKNPNSKPFRSKYIFIR